MKNGAIENRPNGPTPATENTNPLLQLTQEKLLPCKKKTSNLDTRLPLLILNLTDTKPMFTETSENSPTFPSEEKLPMKPTRSFSNSPPNTSLMDKNTKVKCKSIIKTLKELKLLSQYSWTLEIFL